MKKFLSTLIIFFALTFVLPQNIFAAEIPDIRSLNESQIKFSRVDDFNKGKGRYYMFDCLDKKSKEYLVQYVNLLTDNFGYTISKEKKNLFYLIYSGTENISTIADGKTQYHVCVTAGSSWISVYVANGIDIATLQSELAQYGSLNDYELFPIPDIRLLNQEKIKLNDSINLSGSSQYLTFDCSDKKGRGYAMQYVNFLTSKMNFSVLKHKDPHGLFAEEDWELVYSGTGNFSPALLKKHEYHVKISANKNLIFVDFIDGITMVTPQSVSKTPAQTSPVETNPPQITPVSTNQTGGADVPDFAQLGVPYHHSESSKDKKSFLYVFKAGSLSESRADEYVDKYIRLLTGSNFVQTGYDKKHFDRKRVQATRQSETWTFDYRGAKSISSLSDGNALTLKRVRNPQTGDTSFEIRIVKDLIMAGNYAPPKPAIPDGAKECPECDGSGKCKECGGTGKITVWHGDGYYEEACKNCFAGNCHLCGGSGIAY